MKHEPSTLSRLPDMSAYSYSTKTKGNGKSSIELAEPMTPESLTKKLKSIYALHKKGLELERSFNSPMTRLPGRNEFYIKPPAGLGYKINVEKSMRNIMSNLDKEANDGSQDDAEREVNDRIENLVEEFDNHLADYKRKELPARLNEELKDQLNELADQLAEKEKVRGAAGVEHELRDWLEEFDSSFPEYLSEKEREEYEKLRKNGEEEAEEYRMAIREERARKKETELEEQMEKDFSEFYRNEAIPEARKQLKPERDKLRDMYYTHTSHDYADKAASEFKRYLKSHD
ncbi:hypothetical protein AB9P05_18725 [Roseivirga sp. BDSF3-8]|uniref:hypothetical protein n=1 Tax=Roseivirga sp. BDSF3-8 TaxID=3241598 RepID=UPI003531C218